MLYKLNYKSGKPSDLSLCPFEDLGQLGNIEKNLEDLIANHLLDLLFEEAPLMPILQERQWQAEADLYALDRGGNLVIFEFKRGRAGSDAMLQAIRYAQDAGQWSFSKLEEKYQLYNNKSNTSLAEAHKEAFDLDSMLSPTEFNRSQHLVIIGSAANDSLIAAVDYWKKAGLSVDFLPYRIYKIGEDSYFELFSPPYDQHQNIAFFKGVIFDTNKAYDDDSIWEMMDKKRVAAYGDVKDVVSHLNPKDYVFFSHKGASCKTLSEINVCKIDLISRLRFQRSVRSIIEIS